MWAIIKKRTLFIILCTIQLAVLLVLLPRNVSFGLVYIALAFHFTTTYNMMWISGIQTLLWGFFTVLSIDFFQRFLINESSFSPRGSVMALMFIYMSSLLSYEGSLSILNPSGRPLFSYWTDLKQQPALPDIAYFILILACGFALFSHGRTIQTGSRDAKKT